MNQNLLKDESILNQLPKELECKELLIFDSIRFTLETIQYDFDQMLHHIRIYTNDRKIINGDSVSIVVPICNHCWHFIDGTNRLIKLNALLYKNDKFLHYGKNKGLVDKLKVVVPLRDTYQHLNERIDQILIDRQIPFYGIITWDYNHSDKEEVHKYYVYPGLRIKGMNPPIKIYACETLLEQICNLKLQSAIRNNGKSKKYMKSQINLIELFCDIGEYVSDLEQRVINETLKKSYPVFNWNNMRDNIFNVAVTIKNKRIE